VSMKAVPRLLGKVKEWNPKTNLVSFKLETDSKILKEKATNSMKKYG